MLQIPHVELQLTRCFLDSKSPTTDIWLMEDVFPQVEGILSPSRTLSAASKDVLVVLDTNVLMLPFRVATQTLSQIRDVYKRLVDEGKLYVPTRVVREFVRHRDARLAEIAQSLRDKSSRVIDGVVDIPSLLEGLPETQAVTDTSIKLKEARKQYQKAISSLVSVIHGWRSSDPVTAIYHELFGSGVLVESSESRAQIEKEWEGRLQRQIPPGYKDGSKPDTGIGDFLIWLSILKLGEVHKKDLIFVTGEEKSDWFVRSGNEGIYQRPELTDEYRRISNGKQFRLSKLADVLSDLAVTANVISEIREAEIEANTEIQAAASLSGSSNPAIYNLSQSPSRLVGNVAFDYSKHDGWISLGGKTPMFSFDLRFGKASDEAIYLMQGRRTERIARAKGVKPGQVLSFDQFDSTSRSYRIGLGEVFLAKNMSNAFLVGRILSISDDTRGASSDEVRFVYDVFDTGEAIIAP